MSNTAIDFSGSIAEIEEAERALIERRKQKQNAKARREAKKSTEQNVDESGGAKRTETVPPEGPRESKKQPSVLPVQIAKQTRRTAITLKVVEEKAERFHELFYRLKALKDSRTKQDLADEALDLLFEKYKKAFT